MTSKKYEPIFVSEMPNTLEEGKLYIAIHYGAILHLCPCGCKKEISTPLNRKSGWTMRYDGEYVSLSPSIGNYSYPCGSHYYIKDNSVVWVVNDEKDNFETKGNEKCSRLYRIKNAVLSLLRNKK